MTQLLHIYKNGHWEHAANVPPDRNLLHLLREDLGLSDAKEGCGQGDCGACTVMVAQWRDGRLVKRAVNACITMAHSVQGQAVITSADLGSVESPHPVHTALTAHHATQCGFCTPGFAISLAALQAELSAGLHPQPLARETVQEAISGNLCRCTGYRSIVDAGLSLEAGPETLDADLAQALQAQAEPAWQADASYAQPRLAEHALQHRQLHPDAQVLAGSTDVSLWINKGHQRFTRILDLSRVSAWQDVHCDADALQIGAAVNLQDAWAAITGIYPQASELAHRFAGRPVRNAGTLVGNIANASPIGDAMPLLLALDAQLSLARWDIEAGQIRHRRLALHDFYLGYRQTALADDELIAQVSIPRVPHLMDTVNASASGRFLQVYKVSKRFEDDISALCFALCIDLVGGVIQHARIGLGGVAATPVRATLAEQALEGKAWTPDTVRAAQQALSASIQPISDMRASADYRSGVVLNLMQRAWLNSQANGPLSVFAHELRPVEVTP